MRVADQSANTPQLNETRRRIERWRETRRHRNVPMPAALWAGAVAAAREHGLYTTARRLRVDYGALKKHLEAAAQATRAADRPTFIEVPAAPVFEQTGAVACVIEIDGTSGTRRIHLQGLAPVDALAVARMVWSATA